MVTNNKVLIVGGGLAGLSAAIQLKNKGVEFELHEKSDKLGGRVATEEMNGFLLDLGFQVFLDSYEEASAIINYEDLELQSAGSGAVIFKNNSWRKFGNPLKRPLDVFSTLFSGIGNLRDKFLVFKLSQHVTKLNQELIHARENISTLAFLKGYGFSHDMIEHFFKPFFGGVFLDFELKTSARLFLNLFKKFAEGNATLPKGGMKAIITAMEKQLPENSIHLNSEIDLSQISKEKKVIVAVNKSAITSGSSSQFNGTTCLYFSCDRLNMSNLSYLHLNPSGKLVRHVCFLNRIQPSYAPVNNDLLSVTINFSKKYNLLDIEDELQTIFDQKLYALTFLNAYHIPEALNFFDGEMKGVHKNSEGHVICGDHTLYPSINAAIKSGRLAAEIVLKELA